MASMTGLFKGNVSDAARRVSDTYALHRLADPIGNIGQWFACKLSDGATDGVLYPSKAECIRYQTGNEQLYAYAQIVPATMSPQDAEIFLRIHRKLYDAGIRMVDPDDRNGGVSLIKRNSHEDMMASVRAALGTGRPRNLIVDGRLFK